MKESKRFRRYYLDKKKTKEKKIITISIYETDEEIAVKVKDDGIGIEGDELPSIFDSFHRGKTAEKKERNSIARKLKEAEQKVRILYEITRFVSSYLHVQQVLDAIYSITNQIGIAIRISQLYQ